MALSTENSLQQEITERKPGTVNCIHESVLRASKNKAPVGAADEKMSSISFLLWTKCEIGNCAQMVSILPENYFRRFFVFVADARSLKSSYPPSGVVVSHWLLAELGQRYGQIWNRPRLGYLFVLSKPRTKQFRGVKIGPWPMRRFG
jgi:hypothetical protein